VFDGVGVGDGVGVYEGVGVNVGVSVSVGAGVKLLVVVETGVKSEGIGVGELNFVGV